MLSVCNDEVLLEHLGKRGLLSVPTTQVSKTMVLYASNRLICRVLLNCPGHVSHIDEHPVSIRRIQARLVGEVCDAHGT